MFMVFTNHEMQSNLAFKKGASMVGKQVISLPLTLLLAFSLAGCGNSAQEQVDTDTESATEQSAQAQNGVQSQDDSDSSEQPESSSLLSGGGEWPSTKVGRTFPEPQFASKPYSVSTSGDTAAIIYYDNVTSDEVTAYINTLKDAGYTNNVSEMRSDGMYDWSADDGNSDGLCNGIVSIRYMSENGDHKNDIMLQIAVMP